MRVARKDSSIKMNEDYSKTVSFINNYFALADGLVLGLENCLAKNVVLDWFGKSIIGRTNVATFMNTHKVNSRHVFNDIIPTDSIGYKKLTCQTRRRKSKILNSFSSNGNISVEYQSSFKNNPINKTISSDEQSRSSSKIVVEGNYSYESDLTFELYDDELCNLFKLENIKLTNVEEIEQQINQISLEEKLNMQLPRKRESKKADKLKNIDVLKSSIKYVKAQGEILFSKKSRRHSVWSDCKLISSSSTHTWRKPCKLQIAYSSQQICMHQTLPDNNNSIKIDRSSNFSQTQRLKLDKITEFNNHFVSNVNDLTVNLKNNNFIKEKDIFLKNLDEYLSKNEAIKLGLIPRYIDGQLVFQKKMCDNSDFERNFIFNHSIHVIIYEGRSRCRMNLSKKFQ